MNRFKTFLGLLIALACATSCASRTLEDFQEEGEGVVRSLIQELRVIHTHEQLGNALGRLQHHFDRLVTIIIAAQESYDAHMGLDKNGCIQLNHELSDHLRIELNRLYRLEGGRQLIEKCQEKALHRLDAFERKRAASMLIKKQK